MEDYIEWYLFMYAFGSRRLFQLIYLFDIYTQKIRRTSSSIDPCCEAQKWISVSEILGMRSEYHDTNNIFAGPKAIIHLIKAN